MASGVDQLTEGHPDALSIAELYDGVEGALSRAFPRGRGVWVRGEIQSLSERGGQGHCYFDLIDPDSTRDRQTPVLKVKCWRRTWAALRSQLTREGVELAPGMVVVLRGSIDFYRARAEVSFILSEVDVTALLGRLAAERATLLRTLDEEGLLGRNRALIVPPVPQRVGLVASPGTEGYRDFVGQLTGSGFAFDVAVARVTVQGGAAPEAIARAITSLDRHGVDLIVLVRGGGSKGDLAAFDAERVARALVGAGVPVWTGIGHTGDESVADIVANRSYITPTECGRELAQRVSGWWEQQVASPAATVRRRTDEVLQEVATRDALARRRLTNSARQQLNAHETRLGARVDRVVARAPAAHATARAHLTSRRRSFRAPGAQPPGPAATSRCRPGAGCWRPTTSTGSSSGATA